MDDGAIERDAVEGIDLEAHVAGCRELVPDAVLSLAVLVAEAGGDRVRRLGRRGRGVGLVLEGERRHDDGVGAVVVRRGRERWCAHAHQQPQCRAAKAVSERSSHGVPPVADATSGVVP